MIEVQVHRTAGPDETFEVDEIEVALNAFIAFPDVRRIVLVDDGVIVDDWVR